MAEPTKINFMQRHIQRIEDITDLVAILFPGNRNQQYAASCLFFELKWADGMVPNLSYLEEKYRISRRILQRTRAKMARLGMIEHISYLNSRYGGQSGWKLSSRFEIALRQLAHKCAGLRGAKQSNQAKERMLLDYADCRRGIHKEEPT